MDLLRVQDKEGRGPWRPGFSCMWMNKETPRIGKPCFEDFRNWNQIVKKAHKKGLNVCCAVREDKFNLWFNDGDLRILRGFGYKIVNCVPCDVLAESDTQAVIGWNLDFRFLPEHKG